MIQIYALSYVKLTITLCKYVPQAVANYKAKSTIGFAIETILLDLLGGVLSLLQLVIDSALQSSGSKLDGIKGNPVKFGLAFVSLVFDAVFMIQHYVLYPAKSSEIPAVDTAPLLG